MTTTDTTTSETVDARKLRCTEFAYIDTSYGRITYAGVLTSGDPAPVVNYHEELARRGDDHVHSCAGIYPTGYRAGVALFEGPVCAYGTEGERDALVETADQLLGMAPVTTTSDEQIVVNNDLDDPARVLLEVDGIEYALWLHAARSLGEQLIAAVASVAEVEPSR